MSILVILDRSSFRVLFDKIACVYLRTSRYSSRPPGPQQQTQHVQWSIYKTDRQTDRHGQTEGRTQGCFIDPAAIAEGPRDASCQLKSCQLPRNSAETTYTTSPDQIDGIKLEI